MTERELRVKCRGCGARTEGGIYVHTDRETGKNFTDVWGMFFYEKPVVKHGPWSPVYLCDDCEKYQDDLI